ncbi:hypothetical protein BU17DRAFT_69968 [Hysterangium stoloniferum]|nr:hypothetical protein BU17DRAFT_69968 [Hysterangium stoloniferum]
MNGKTGQPVLRQGVTMERKIKVAQEFASKKNKMGFTFQNGLHGVKMGWMQSCMNGKTGECKTDKMGLTLQTGLHSKRQMLLERLGLVSHTPGNKKDTTQHDVIWSLHENEVDAVMHEWEERPISVEAGSNYRKN